MSQPLVILHIGRGKTGTTAIQRFLSRNREWLERQGVWYVRAGDEAAGGHQDLAMSFIETLPGWMDRSSRLDTIQTEVRRELQGIPSPCYLLSSENFTLSNPAAIKAYFESCLGPVQFKIVFYASSQDELAESQYNQDVKWSCEALDFDAYIANSHFQECEFDVLLQPWAGVFGVESIVAGIFDASAPSVIPGFLSSLQLEVQGSIESIATINPSMGYLALEVLRRLNGFGLNANRPLYDDVQDFLRSQDFPFVLFSSDAARQFRMRFVESNKRFSAQYFGREMGDLGGRRYSDSDRDRLFKGQSPIRTASK